MPNVTITVPEELKTQMDELSEVSWSEICRNAISLYISQRKAPTPKIDLDIRGQRLYDYDFDTGYPTLTIDIKIQNRMNSEITVDRILATARFFNQDRQMFPLGHTNDLRRKIIGANSVGGATIRFIFPREKLTELKNAFKSTFDCIVNCAVFVDGFKNEYNQEVTAQIPIDVWNGVIKKALGTKQATQ